MKKIIAVVIVIIVLGGLGFWGYSYTQKQASIRSIASFDACAKEFPILESYPPQCKTPDGRTFTQDIGNELEYKDEIIVANPRPNQVVTSPLKVHGNVRGRWLFEASFSGELFDANNTSLGTAILTAEGDWMTIDFVPFNGELTFSNPITKTGTLKIINANPSGLPENHYELRIPVEFGE